MSTILNTLKKLEEEKSVLDRSLNLKGLVLQTDRALYPQAERANISPGKALLALVIGGIAVGVSLGIYLNPEKAASKDMAQALPVNIQKTEPAPPVQEPVPPVQTPTRDVATGIPLASIPEEAATKLPSAPVQPPKADPQPKQSPNQQPALPSSKEEPVDPINISMDLLPDFHEINAIVEDSKVKKIKPLPKEARHYDSISVPFIKMKGIIYFSEKNPANYILLSGTPPETNRKLKIGETVQDATLMEVLPSSAIFSYKGQISHMRIGE